MNDIKLALWKNDNRPSPKHPPLSAGKPVNINGQDYWISAYINGPRDNAELRDRIEKFITYLAEQNGTYPIINVSLRPAESRGQRPSAPTSEGAPFDDSIPF